MTRFPLVARSGNTAESAANSGLSLTSS